MKIAFLHRMPQKTAVLASGILLTFSSLLLVGHAMRVRQMQEMGLPAALLIPALQEEMQLLREQTDGIEVESLIENDASGDAMRAYVLPDEIDPNRLLRALDVAFDTWRKDGLLFAFSPITVEEETVIEATMTEEGVSHFMTLLRLSGYLTVGDVIGSDDREALLAVADASSPETVTSLKQFLALDLINFARDGNAHLDSLLLTVTSDESLHVIRSIVGTSLLRDAREILSGTLGNQIAANSLWPLPFLTTESVTMSREADDRVHVRVALRMHEKE